MERFCDRMVLLKRGVVDAYGSPDDVIDRYTAAVSV
jgi:ABC-type polysaccharide/polyol phosphate transport system ATPase subunit